MMHTSRASLAAPPKKAKSKAGAAPAKKKAGSFSSKGKKPAAGGPGAVDDGKGSEALKKFLYGSDASARREEDLARQAALEAVLPPPEAQETILRAWHLHKRHMRESHEEDMRKRYETMQSALAKLEEVSPTLFDLATKGAKFSNVRTTKGDAGRGASFEGRIEGLFPRQLPVVR